MRHVANNTQRRAMLMSGIFLAVALVGLTLGDHPAQAATPPDEPLDCKVYETKKSSINVGFKVGHFSLGAGPEVAFGRERGMAWDRIVHGFIARYVELCSRYNAGLVTKEEYERRLHGMEGLYREAQALEARLMDETRNRARAATHELDQALAKGKSQTPAAPDPIKQSLDNLNHRLDQSGSQGRR